MIELKPEGPTFLDLMVKYGFLIGTFAFSMLAKVHSMLRFKRRLRLIPCFMETVLTGLGSALVLYVLLQMDLNKPLFCTIGGFSGLAITPLVNVINKEITPFLELIVKDIKILINSWFKKQNKES